MRNLDCRHVFIVAGGDALPYAPVALQSLFERCQDTIALTILTDTAADVASYEELIRRLDPPCEVAVFDEVACAIRAADYFKDQPVIAEFRKGHPCWRKITDPSMFVESGEEVIVLDPDVYFPNVFSFEQTPPGQLLLMRQLRHCLLPSEVVETAFSKQIALAHHTDIGVAQHFSLPWAWISQTIVSLGGSHLPRVPHIESIVWAAIAMRIGGGYLDPKRWTCWERTAVKRLLLLLGVSGVDLMRLEAPSRMKMFHASSGAKHWLAQAVQEGRLRGAAAPPGSSETSPFVQITRPQYDSGERLKGLYHCAMTKLGLRDPLGG